MRIKVLLMDESKGKDILGFQKSCLYFLHMAIKSQVDMCLTLIVDEPKFEEIYGTYFKCFDTMLSMCKPLLKEVKTEVWISVFNLSDNDIPFLVTMQTDYIAIAKIGDDVNCDKMINYLLKIIGEKQQTSSNNIISDPAIEAAEKAIFGASGLTIEDLTIPNSSTEASIKCRLRQMEADALMYTDKAAEAKLHGEDV